jgi:hypothetical protein
MLTERFDEERSLPQHSYPVEFPVRYPPSFRRLAATPLDANAYVYPRGEVDFPAIAV